MQIGEDVTPNVILVRVDVVQVHRSAVNQLVSAFEGCVSVEKLLGRHTPTLAHGFIHMMPFMTPDNITPTTVWWLLSHIAAADACGNVQSVS